jgi:hypothetical protein
LAHRPYRYTETETGRLYRRGDLTAAKPGGDVSYEWHGAKPYKGRYRVNSRDKMDQMLAEGRIEFRSTGMPVVKRYLDEQPGVPYRTDGLTFASMRDRKSGLGIPPGSHSRCWNASSRPAHGGGRYALDTIKGADLGSDPQGRLVVDLNFAYNPSRAYDDQWACSLAPPANRVAAEIPAELMYARC